MYSEYNIKKKKLAYATLTEEEHLKLRDKTLSDIKVTSVCLGASVGCHLAEWSGGKTGRSHFCDGNGIETSYYVLYSDVKTDELVRATIAGKCNHSHLDVARRNIDGKTKKEREKDNRAAFRELRELILLVGNRFEQFYTAWRISLNPSDKKFYDSFMDNKRDLALMECAVMLGSKEYRDTVSRLPGETEFENEKRFRQQAVLHLNAIQQLATGSYADFQIDHEDYNNLTVVIRTSIAGLKNNRLMNNCFLDFNSESAIYLFIERAGYGHMITDEARKKWLGK
jgi:hypothetical protein